MADDQSKWADGHYREALDATRLSRGKIYRGIALTKLWRGSPKGRRPPAWSLTHIGTGHTILNFEAHDPFQFATKIAECGEWDFEGLDGYLNRDPTLRDKLGSVLTANSDVKVMVGGMGSSHDAAKSVAIANA